jgi:hypothetical protein
MRLRMPDRTRRSGMRTAPDAKQKGRGLAACFAIACIFPVPITKRILHNAAAKNDQT